MGFLEILWLCECPISVGILPQLYRVTGTILLMPQFPHPSHGNINVFPSLPHGEHSMNSSGKLGVILCKCVNFSNGLDL